MASLDGHLKAVNTRYTKFIYKLILALRKSFDETRINRKLFLKMKKKSVNYLLKIMQ